MIDILVLNYNDAITTTNFVLSVKDYSCVHKILVVDNHSTDNSFVTLKKLENDKVVIVDSGKNGGYGAGNNFGVRYLCENFHSERILICNPDVIISEDVIIELSMFMKQNDEYAVVAPLMKIPNNGNNYSAYKKTSLLSFVMSVELLFSKFFEPIYFDISHCINNDFIDVFSVAGSLFMIDANKFGKDALYDENIFLYFEEFVLGKRVQKKNYKIALLPKLSFIHNHSVSVSKTYKNEIRKKMIYLRSYRYVVKQYFDSNLFHRVLSYVMSAISLFEVFVWSHLKRAK